MKKLLLFLLIVICCNNLCYAKTKISKKQLPQYRQDMTAIVEKIAQDKNYIENKSILEYIASINSKTLQLQKNFYTNKNDMRKNKMYIDTLHQYDKDLSSLLHNIHEDFNNVVSKYSLEISGDYFTCLEQNYLVKYTIPNARILSDIVISKNQCQSLIRELVDEIQEYSIAYETQKVKNFKNKYVTNKIFDLDDKLAFQGIGALKTNTLYVAKLKVFQILQNGFLAYTYFGDGNIIFVQTNLNNRLEPGDMFVPHLFLKHNGKMYSYRSLLGSYNSVPVFTIVDKNEFYKMTNIPTIAEEFYFVEKPQWEFQWSNVSLHNYNYSDVRPFLK